MKNAHLSLEDRKKIQEGLENQLSELKLQELSIKIFPLFLKKLKTEEN